MSFQPEESETRVWSRMQAEHHILETAMTAGRHPGLAGYLDHRVVDPERKLALYYVKGIGMGDGRRFALVREGEIVGFDVMKTRRSASNYELIEVAIPEKLNGLREVLLPLIVESVTAYHMFFDVFFEGETAPPLGLDKLAWRLIPQRYSWLFWKTEWSRWWSRQQPKFTRARTVLKSPMAALLALLGAVLFALLNDYSPAWPLGIGGLWLWYFTDSYDAELYFWPWFTGRLKAKNPLSYLANTLLQMHAVPLACLTVKVQVDPADQHTCLLRLKNTSAFFVPYVFIRSTDLADLVAPGFVGSLRSGDGRLDVSKVDAVFASLRKKWLLPFQQVTWRVKRLPDFPLVELAPQVQAMVVISRRLSGQRKPGAQVYSLSVQGLEFADRRQSRQ